MYNVKSMKAEEFINHEEIMDTLRYADANKDNIALIDSIIQKARLRKGLNHREASVLLACEIPEKINEIYELAEQINCSSPYLSNAQTVVIPGNKEKQYETVEEYQHMLFAVESGSTGEALVKELKYRYVTYATQREAVESVDKNQCDAAVIDGVMASCYVGAGHEFENLAMGVSLNDEKICVGLRKGSNLTGKLEDYFIKVSEDGTFQSLAAAYGLEEAILSMEE